MNLIESSKELMASPGMQAFYKAWDDAEAFVASDSFIWGKVVILVVGLLFLVGFVDWRKKDAE